MLRSRYRIARVIAAALAFTLSSQLAGTTGMNCTQAGGDHAKAGHEKMSQGGHAAGEASILATHDNSAPDGTSNTGACTREIGCVNVSPVPVMAARSADMANSAPPVFLGTGVLRGRTLKPDTPPPRA